MDERFPYWIIYRNEFFDKLLPNMDLAIFEQFRDRQITNKVLTNNSSDSIRVLRSRNIADDGSEIVDVIGYDRYISENNATDLSVYKYLNRSDVYLVPNMTYKPRIIRKPSGTLANGSAAILSLKEGESHLNDRQQAFIASTEFREFYKIARNRQTRSLNIDANSVFFIGRLK
jgi:DNA (cytosine-5)-methyltransferase 1